MRTTLRLDDDVLRAARSLARADGKTVGEVVSELARRGLRPAAPRPRRGKGGIPYFEVPTRAAPITIETVRAAIEDEG